MLQRVVRTANGLFLQNNPIGEIPEGALLEADNVSIDREGVLSKRRGLNRYGQPFTPTAIFEFQGQLMGLQGSTLKRDVNGNGSEWRSITGSYSPPDSGTRMRSVQGLKSLYFTTSLGLKKMDSISATPVMAGMPPAVDLQASLTGTGNSWFNVSTQTAYRCLWGRIDANDQLILGAPSFREVLPNPYSGVKAWTATGAGPYTVTVTHVAHGYAVNDVIEVLETDASGNTVTPSALNAQFTVASVPTADSFTFSVATDPASPGNLISGKKFNVLITIPIPDGVVEGDFYELYRSDLSPDLATDPGDRLLKVVRVVVTATDISNGYVQITDNKDPAFLGEDLYTNPAQETILQQNSQPPWCRDTAPFRDNLFFANTMQREFLDIQMVDIVGLVIDTSSLTLTLGATTRTYTFSASEDIATRKVKVHSSEPTLALAIEKTMKSLVRVINRDSGNATWDAFYTSGPTDPPGIVGIQARALNTGAFTIICDNLTNTGSKFNPAVPASGTLYTSDNDRQVSRLYFSKAFQPEAVPEANFFDIGDASKAIIRIVPTRDALFILKEDGVWRLSGDTEVDFTVRQVDPTQRIRIPESAVVLDNAVWCFTSDGIVRITEAGTVLMSRAIEDELLKIFTHASFDSLCHATAYQSEGKYILWAPGDPTQTTVTVAWVYNTLTRAWSRWLKPISATWIFFPEDRLYAAHAEDGYLLQERKSLDSEDTDFQDEDIPITFGSVGTSTDEDGNSVSTVDVVFTYEEPQPGWAFVNNPATIPRSEIIAVTLIAPDQYRLTLESLIPGLVAGDGHLVIAIPTRIRWLPEDLDNVGLMKQFSAVQIYLESGTAFRHRVGFSSDLQTTESIVDIKVPTTTLGQLLKLPVPRAYQRSRALNLIYVHRICKENVEVLQATFHGRPYSQNTTMVPR